MKVVAVVQARVTSSRLPRKVLLPIAGQPMLVHVVDRLRACELIDEVVVATSSDPSDDEIVAFCGERDIPCGRGPLEDVLRRFVDVAAQFEADVIVRVTSDCPLVDPKLVDDVIREYRTGEWDYVANRLPEERTYPIGLDAEVFSLASLRRADAAAREPYQREHVTPWFYDGTGACRVGHVKGELDRGWERWTVDTPEDLEFVREIYGRLGSEATRDWLAVLQLLAEHPELRKLNQGVRQKSFKETS